MSEQFISINGRKLYTRVTGSGPVIVLNSGGGAPGVGCWEPLESRLAGFATVVTWDRAGLGRSDPPASPPSASDMADDLHLLIVRLKLPAPVILAGWSLSSLGVQLYAHRHPSEVAAMLLLEPTPDHLFRHFFGQPAAQQASIRTAMANAGRHLGSDAGLLLEASLLPESAEQVRTAFEHSNPLKALPVAIISAGQLPAFEGRTVAGNLVTVHERLLRRYPGGSHYVAHNATHGSMVKDSTDLLVSVLKQMVDPDRAE